MIQVNELRIRNYVLYPDGVNDVETIDHNDEDPNTEGYELYMVDGYKPSELNGLPITVDLLKSVSFEEHKNIALDGINEEIISYSLNGYHFIEDINGNWFLSGYNWNTKHFKFFHQLQNIYYALSGDEIIKNGHQHLIMRAASQTTQNK